MVKITEDMVIKAVADECRRDFFYFVKTFWDIIIQEQPVYNWHIPYLCHELMELSRSVVAREEKPYDLIINIPPSTTKSTIVTVMFPAWLWTQDSTLRIISNSYSSGLSIDHAQKSKDIIASDRYKMLFPEVEIRHDKSGKQYYANSKGGFRYASSTGGTITGLHAHIIINDDPVNPKQAESDTMRKSANDHLKTLSSRKVDRKITPMITIMQRLHQDDVTGHLLSHKGGNIRHINLPAEDCEFVRPIELREKYVDGLLDPVRLSRKVLDEAKVDMGSRAYAGQYMQMPSAEGGNIVKESWFKHISQAEFTTLRFNETIHFFLDTAYKENDKKANNDPSGILAGCKIGNNIYILNATQVWKEFPDLIKFIPEYMKANGADHNSSLRVEPKANGISLVQTLKAVSGLNVVETPSPTDSKAERLHAVSPKIEAGRVILVDGEWTDEFVDEVAGFPQKVHDEFVDILGYAINYFESDDFFVMPANLNNLF